MDKNVVRLAAVGDIHYTRKSQGLLVKEFSQLSQLCDVLVLCGDLTDYGLPEEAEVLLHDLAVVNVPIVAVLGNHDFESGRQDELMRMFAGAGVHMLDGDAVELHGVGFAGVKGFGGGFGRRTLGAWGEKAIKNFVQEALDEAMKLEAAMSRLRMQEKIVVLHYAPIQATATGEPLEIMPFLGSSRLEEPIVRYRASAVFHGHAHHGSLEGKTKSDVPVFNVCFPLLKRSFPDQLPFRFYDVPRESADRDAAVTSGADVVIR